MGRKSARPAKTQGDSLFQVLLDALQPKTEVMSLFPLEHVVWSQHTHISLDDSERIFQKFTFWQEIRKIKATQQLFSYTTHFSNLI